MSQIWAGIDSGKGHHHGLVLDTDGRTLLSRRVANDEPELLKLIGDVLDLADGREVTWAIDMTGGEPALLLALLVGHGQEVLYMPGRLVNRASDGYRGEGKTDARDAYVIADQASMRRDLRPIRPGDDAAIELKLLTGRRADLVEDRTRVVNRLRGTLLSMFPALERALDVTNTGPLKLLTGYQTPAAIRRSGVTRLTKWLANRKVRNARALAETAVEAAERRHTAVPGEKTIAKLVHTLAEEVMALNEQIRETDKLIEGRFHEHELADILLSVPGIGATLLTARLVLAFTDSIALVVQTMRRAQPVAAAATRPFDTGSLSGGSQHGQRQIIVIHLIMRRAGPGAGVSVHLNRTTERRGGDQQAGRAMRPVAHRSRSETQQWSTKCVEPGSKRHSAPARAIAARMFSIPACSWRTRPP